MGNVHRDGYDARYYAEMATETRELPPKLEAKLAQWFVFVGQEIRPGAAALDAGCGTGTIAKFLTRRGVRVVGLDGFEMPAAQAREIVPDARFVVADLHRPLPFNDAAFDLVLSYEVIEHLADATVFLAESRRVLRPGGALLVKTPNALDFYRFADPVVGRTWYADEDKTHVHYFSQFEMARALRRAGFSGVRVRSGTKPFFRKWRRWHRWFNPRLPVFGNGVAGRGVRPG
jgi:SAM-dependent methyltransferase